MKRNNRLPPIPGRANLKVSATHQSMSSQRHFNQVNDSSSFVNEGGDEADVDKTNADSSKANLAPTEGDKF